jgi:hypothetical protein
MIRRLCVFCGSSAGREPGYRHLAESLARTLAERGIGIVYGGAWVGLMGALADAALAAELADGFVALPAGSARSRSCSRCGPGRSSASTPSHAPLTAHSPEELLTALAAYRPPRVGKWLEAPAAHLD